MIKHILCLLILTIPISDILGQMTIGGESRFGNEWIDYTKEYYKIRLAEDGMYKLSISELEALGFDFEGIRGNELQLFYFGEEQGIVVSTEGTLNSDDFIIFYGKKNRGELDAQVYENPEERQLNPHYSLFSDTSTYFLTINSGNNKRIEELVNTAAENNAPESPYYLHRAQIVFSDYHHKPVRQDARYSSFDIGEGFGSELENDKTYELQLSNIYSDGTKPSLSIRFATNSRSHLPEIFLGGALVKRDTFSDYAFRHYDVPFDNELLSDNMSVRLRGAAAENDRYVTSEVSISYPRTFVFNNESELLLDILPSLNTQNYVLENVNTQNGTPVVYDQEGAFYISSIVDNGNISFSLPASSKTRKIVVTNQESLHQVAGVEVKKFTDFRTIDPNYLILTGTPLYQDSSLGVNMVEEYASYRRSEEGGGYNVDIVFADELYDQFSYGIDRHSMSVRNFSHYIESQWDELEFMFILGKGVIYDEYRTNDQITKEQRQKFSVPTFGSPGSDNLLLSRIGSSVPFAAVGRIAARSADDVRIYLDKVKIHENPIPNDQTLEDQLWRKKMIHLSGGDRPILQKVIFDYLSTMEEQIVENDIGADITTYRKTSSDPIQTSTSSEILNRINNGVSLITFFGHSAVGTFDFSIEEPSKYNNYGKYPLILSLGCLSGDIHAISTGLSIDFVIEENKAAIAFLASSGNAYVNPSFNSGFDIYQGLSKEMYGESLGKVVRNSLQKRDSNKIINVVSLNEQLTLHGDPAIRIHDKPGPDLIVDFESLKTFPTIVSTNKDSFELSFDVYNIGRKYVGSTRTEIQHLSPKGELEYSDTIEIEVPSFANNVKVNLPIRGVSIIGKNSIKINIDIDNNIPELPAPAAEENNSLIKNGGETQDFCFYILDNGATPVYPTEFGIVNNSDVKLKASTSNGFVERQEYIFQIDTTELFNSPSLKEETLTLAGGLIEWSPNIAMEASRVYYWRVSPKSSLASNEPLWSQSSFVYLPEEDGGWNQSHYYQVLKDDFNGLDLQVSRTLHFDTIGFNISLFNKNYLSDQLRGVQFNFETISFSTNPWGSMREGIAVVWGDAITGGFKFNLNGQFGSLNYGDSQRFFGYNTKDPEGRSKLINFLTNEIPDGSFVYIIAIASDEGSSFGPEFWQEDEATLGTTLFDIFENEGAEKVRTLETVGSVPYNFIYVKGENSDLHAEGLAEDGAFVKTDFFVPIRGVDGKLKSRIIGPAKAWEKIEWSETGKNGNDISYINLYGIDNTGKEVALDTAITAKNYNLSSIDASVYSRLRLEYFSSDPNDRTSPQLDYWRVVYAPLPEAALNPMALLNFEADTIQQGQELKLDIAVDNLTDIGMDSLLVKYTLLNKSNQEEISETRIAPLPESGRITASYRKSTLDLLGRYQFSIEINPDNDQPEQFSFNNFAIKEFEVEGDVKNPLMDVTFDGVHILNGDIVSPEPLILIDLTDDNKYLPIKDISAFELALLYPNQTDPVNIPLTDPTIKFIPATEEDNRAMLEFSPDLEEGEYRLFVQTRDASGNFSGEKRYEVTFQVIKAREITNVLNYPNPFSTSTQFVFTLTGEVPDVFTIRIMTLSGKVVKEITKEELGEVRLGVNRTKYRWNGTDDFGNQLANGVYLYRVIMNSSSGETFEKRFNGTDQYFQKGFGKMVLLR